MSSLPPSLTVALALLLTGAPVSAVEPVHNDVLAQEQAAAALQQVRQQEQLLQALRTSNEQQQQTLAQMQTRLAAAESVASWLPWLALALVGSGVLSVWLALRARSLHSARDAQTATRTAASRRTGAGASASGRNSVPGSDASWKASGSSTYGQPTGMGMAPMVVPSRPAEPVTVARPIDPVPAPPPARTSPSPSPDARTTAEFSLGTGVPPREVSVEELLDLEQQVDFFVVLGQDEAAVDLLVSHIRATGGTSPLPYLKLMEIYHRRGNAEDYERTRSRFNKRFSAQAPAWGGDPTVGRSLEDYPDIVEHLQLLWPMPIKAQHEIDVLMHPNDRGQVFDLPAFHDLLILHGLVGDLLGHPVPVHLNDVDIMLPLSDEPLETTAPQPRMASRPMPMQMPRLQPLANLLDNDKTAPAYTSASAPSRPMGLDLDLSDYAPSPREYTEPAAFTDIRLFRDSRGSGFASLQDDGGAPKRSG